MSEFIIVQSGAGVSLAPAFHSKIGETFASTSSIIATGMLSSFLPPRAVRSRALSWLHRTTFDAFLRDLLNVSTGSGIQTLPVAIKN
jgi:hypothetical protein